MVKYTTPLPCIGLSKSDSKTYIIFEFCKGKIIKNWKKNIDLQNQEIYVDKKFKKNLHILKDSSSRLIEHIILQNLFEHD